MRHLHRCGERPVLEVLIAVERGVPLDDALDDVCRLPAEAYRLVGADRMPSLPRVPIVVIDGGAS